MTEGTESILRSMDSTKQRSHVQMSQDEVVEFLATSRKSMTIATMNLNGSVHLVAMGFSILDGFPVLSTKAKSQKVVNLRRNPQISCLVEEGTDYEDLRGVQLVSRAEIVERSEEVFAVTAELMRRHSGFESGAPNRIVVERTMRNRVAIKVHVERCVSWDHRKLSGIGS
jgi:hypothetical protein